ncbi:EGFR adapter protein-like isoform X2 [Rhodnius prolixus]|uniref:EGFR adapter protein-like isoform X2 n=1 Tax=Rhodnius prolixus TaxID=13249 RepID=UPI003D188B68
MPASNSDSFQGIKYLGSFPVHAPDQEARADLIKKKLEFLRTSARPKPVLIVVSLTGIKVCSPDGKEVCMAHALRRISYATCEPAHSQFSFLAREPRAHFSQQYCHAFLAKSPEQAEELNSIVGNAFRMAYAAQLQPQLQQVIQRSVEPTTIVWPKVIPGRGMSGVRPPSSIPGLKTGPPGLAAPSPTSSDESNSPTELNSCRRLGDKPVLVKRLAMGLGTTPSEEEAPLVHNKHPFIINTAKSIDSDNNRVSESPESKRSGGSTTSTPPPPPPERTDSLNNRPDEGELKTAPWFQAGIPREITLEVLGQEPVGSFMVRESTSKPGCFALSLRVPHEFQPLGIAHYLILRTNKGYKIKGFTKEFPSLTALITHHSVMPELLPCPLSLSRYNPSFDKSDSSRDFADIDTDPDYNTLADFRRMMADLNV